MKQQQQRRAVEAPALARRFGLTVNYASFSWSDCWEVLAPFLLFLSSLQRRRVCSGGRNGRGEREEWERNGRGKKVPDSRNFLCVSTTSLSNRLKQDTPPSASFLSFFPYFTRFSYAFLLGILTRGIKKCAEYDGKTLGGISAENASFLFPHCTGCSFFYYSSANCRRYDKASHKASSSIRGMCQVPLNFYSVFPGRH